MLSKMHFASEIKKLAINFGLKRDDTDYMKFMYEELKQEELTNELLSMAVKILINDKDKLYTLPSKSILINACCWNGQTPRKDRIKKLGQLGNKKPLQIEGKPVDSEKIRKFINSITNKT